MTEPAKAAVTPGTPGQSINLADRVVPGGYFLLRPDAHRTPFTASGADRLATIRHCWTYEGGGSSIRAELVRLIECAQEKVFVGTFFLGDQEVRHALVRAANRLHGGVYVLSALDNKGLDKAINEVDDTTSIDKQTEYRNFGELTKQGIYVRGYPGMHAKFVVVDDNAALVSSANLVSRSLDDEVGENGVILTEPDHVTYLARLFARLWQESPWDMPPHPETPTVLDNRRRRKAKASLINIGKPTGNGPIWTYQDHDEDQLKYRIAETLYEIIEGAQSDLILATYSIANMTHGQPKKSAYPGLLFDPVCRAIGRGVRVRMLLRGRNNSHATRVETGAFADAGVEIRPDRRNHAKGVIADGQRGALFSANFETDLGLTGGVEVGMRLDGTPALSEAQRYFDHVMAEADLTFARNPSLGDLATSLYANALTPWPLPHTIAVIAEDAHWRQLTEQQGVVLYEKSGNGLVVLHTEHDRWQLEPFEDRWWLSPANQSDHKQTAADALEAWLVARAQPTEAQQRGLCPATLVHDEL